MPVNADKTRELAELSKSFISASDARDRLGSALREHLSVQPRDCFWMCDDGVTEDGPVAIYNLERASAEDDGVGKCIGIGPGEFFRIAFKLEAGKYTFGEPVKVRRVTDYQPVAEAGVQKSLADRIAPQYLVPAVDQNPTQERALTPRRLGAALTEPERELAKALGASHRTAAEAQPDAGAKAAHLEAAEIYEGAARTLDTPAYRAEMGRAGALSGLVKSWSGIPDSQRRPFTDFRKSMENPVAAKPFAQVQTGNAAAGLASFVEGSRPAAEVVVPHADPEASRYSPGAINRAALSKSTRAFYERLYRGARPADLSERFPAEAK